MYNAKRIDRRALRTARNLLGARMQDGGRLRRMELQEVNGPWAVSHGGGEFEDRTVPLARAVAVSVAST